MKNASLYLVIYLFLISCNGQPAPSEQTPVNANYVQTNHYKISVGGNTLLSSYDSLFLGRGCNYSGIAYMVMTMPVSCYTTLKPNVDSPISFVSTIDNDACHSAWEYMKVRWAGLGICAPAVVYFPIDTTAYPQSDNDVYHLWFVKKSDYRKFADTFNVLGLRNTDTLFKYNIPIVSAKNVKKLLSWGMESDTGYWAKKLPDNYRYLYSSTGVVVKLLTTMDSTIDCYVISDYDDGSIRWKDTTMSK